jgi:hypothetical protein
MVWSRTRTEQQQSCVPCLCSMQDRPATACVLARKPVEKAHRGHAVLHTAVKCQQQQPYFQSNSNMFVGVCSADVSMCSLENDVVMPTPTSTWGCTLTAQTRSTALEAHGRTCESCARSMHYCRCAVPAVNLGAAVLRPCSMLGSAVLEPGGCSSFCRLCMSTLAVVPHPEGHLVANTLPTPFLSHFESWVLHPAE